MLKRLPRQDLRPFVRVVWALDENDQRSVDASRERVLPTAMMHLVIRLSNHPLRVFDDDTDPIGHSIGQAVVGGARSAPYVRDVSEPVSSVGVQLLPGASELLFGVPADELAGRHTALDEFWGRSVTETRARLCESSSSERRLDILESILAARISRVRGLHPAVAHSLDRFTTTADVRAVVKETGYSHRRFIAVFCRAVGLTPKLYCQVLRFQRVLERIVATPSASWVKLALAAGYSDQPHFNRQFREFTGITPGEYRLLSPPQPNHVPITRSPR